MPSRHWAAVYRFFRASLIFCGRRNVTVAPMARKFLRQPTDRCRPQDLVIFNFLDEARPCCPFRSFANPDAESSRVLVILFGCFFERLNSRVDAHHLSINISEPASPPTISISHSAVRSDSTLPSFRPHSRRRFTTFAIIAARTSVMTSAIVANKLSKSCTRQRPNVRSCRSATATAYRRFCTAPSVARWLGFPAAQ